MEGAGFGHGSLLVDHQGTCLFPKLVVGSAHLFNHLGVLGRYIVLLGWVCEQVKELVAHQTKPGVTHCEVVPLVLVGLRSGWPAGLLGKEVAICELDLLAEEKGKEATTFNLILGE